MKNQGILIVEDEANAALIYEEFLKNEGYTKVFSVSSISDGLNVLAEKGEEIHVVMLDFRLPDGNGFELMKHLINTHSHIVGILMVTAYSEPDLVNQFYDLGNESVVSSNFMEKPLDLKELLTKLERVTKSIRLKREAQKSSFESATLKKLDHLDASISSSTESINQLINRINKIENKIPNFLQELGMDIIRLFIIGLAVLAFLYFDLGNAILEIIKQAP